MQSGAAFSCVASLDRLRIVTVLSDALTLQNGINVLPGQSTRPSFANL